MLLLTVGVDLHCLDCSVVALNFISLHCTVLCCTALHNVLCVALYVRHWAGNLGWWPKPIYTLLQPADIADGIAHCAILLAQASHCTFRQSFAQEQEHFTFAQCAICSDKGSRRVGIDCTVHIALCTSMHSIQCAICSDKGTV